MKKWWMCKSAAAIGSDIEWVRWWQHKNYILIWNWKQLHFTNIASDRLHENGLFLLLFQNYAKHKMEFCQSPLWLRPDQLAKWFSQYTFHIIRVAHTFAFIVSRFEFVTRHNPNKIIWQNMRIHFHVPCIQQVKYEIRVRTTDKLWQWYARTSTAMHRNKLICLWNQNVNTPMDSAAACSRQTFVAV